MVYFDSIFWIRATLSQRLLFSELVLIYLVVVHNGYWQFASYPHHR